MWVNPTWLYATLAKLAVHALSKKVPPSSQRSTTTPVSPSAKEIDAAMQKAIARREQRRREVIAEQRRVSEEQERLDAIAMHLCERERRKRQTLMSAEEKAALDMDARETEARMKAFWVGRPSEPPRRPTHRLEDDATIESRSRDGADCVSCGRCGQEMGDDRVGVFRNSFAGCDVLMCPTCLRTSENEQIAYYEYYGDDIDE